jgi:hypothetical protein
MEGVFEKNETKIFNRLGYFLRGIKLPSLGTWGNDVSSVLTSLLLF